jgi:hypothetical protein
MGQRGADGRILLNWILGFVNTTMEILSQKVNSSFTG